MKARGLDSRSRRWWINLMADGWKEPPVRRLEGVPAQGSRQERRSHAIRAYLSPSVGSRGYPSNNPDLVGVTAGASALTAPPDA